MCKLVQRALANSSHDKLTRIHGVLEALSGVRSTGLIQQVPEAVVENIISETRTYIKSRCFQDNWYFQNLNCCSCTFRKATSGVFLRDHFEGTEGGESWGNDEITEVVGGIRQFIQK